MNKVNTKVDMRLHLDRADWLDEDIREAVRRAVSGCVCVLGWGLLVAKWESTVRACMLFSESGSGCDD